MHSPHKKDTPPPPSPPLPLAPPLLPLLGRTAPSIYLGAGRPSRAAAARRRRRQAGRLGFLRPSLQAGWRRRPVPSFRGGRGGNASAGLAMRGRGLARACRRSRSPAAAVLLLTAARAGEVPSPPASPQCPAVASWGQAVCRLALPLVLAGIFFTCSVEERRLW